jgi:hypothetical protein
MKRLIAAVSFAVLAAPALAQSTSVGRTSAIGPDWVFNFPANSGTVVAQSGQDRTQASSGATRSDTEIATDIAAAQAPSTHVENQPGYFDPSN